MRGVEFMWPLVNDMVQDDPGKRPTMDDVVERFEKIRRSLHWWTLRSRLVYRSDSIFSYVTQVRHPGPSPFRSFYTIRADQAKCGSFPIRDATTHVQILIHISMYFVRVHTVHCREW